MTAQDTKRRIVSCIDDAVRSPREDPTRRPASCAVATVEAQPLAVVVSAAIATLLAAHMLLRIVTGPKSKIAVPKSSLSILKNTIDLMFYHGHRLYDWDTEQFEAVDGKPWIRAVIGNTPSIMISTPELFEDILKTQFEHFRKGDVSWFNDLFEGNNIAGDDGPVSAFPLLMMCE